MAAPDHAPRIASTFLTEKPMNTRLLNAQALRIRNLPLAVAAAAAAMASGAASAEDWQWAATPYVWATDLGVELTVADRSLVDAEVPFSDLVDKLDGAALVRVEGMRGQHGMAFDLFSVELVDAHVVELPGGSGANLAIDARVGLSILDAAGVYDAHGDGEGFALVYGARVIEQRNAIDTTLARGGMTIGGRSFDTTDTLIDGLVGLRYARALPHNFSYAFAADVSTGDTELTWSAGPTIGYAFGDGDRYQVTAGYRRMDVDFATAEHVDADMSMSGLSIGFRIEF
jgi:hypothetical protein